VERTIFDDDSAEISCEKKNVSRIRKELCVNDFDTEDDIVKNIQVAYDKAVKYLKESLFYQPSDFWSAWKYKFDSFDDIIHFLDETRNARGKKYCRIVKQTISWYNTDIDINHEIASVVDKTNGVIKWKLIPWLQLKERNDRGFSWIVTLGSETGFKVIWFRFESRLKSQESMVSKEIRDPKYFLLENLSDIYWWKFYLKDRLDILPFSQYVSWLVFKKGKFEIKDRWMFSDEEIEKSVGIHDAFRENCQNRKKDRKNISSDIMRDWRVIAPYKKDDETNKLSLELWFVLDSSENESWLASQYIYSFLRKIDEVIRLDQYIFPNHIENIVNACIKVMTEEQKQEVFRALRDEEWLIWKKIKLSTNPHARSNIDSYLRDWLSIYFLTKSNTKEIRTKWWKKSRIAYSNDRQISMHDLKIINGF
jgi:hypothetical protein